MKPATLFLVAVLAAPLALADSLPDLFAKVKEQVKAEKWTDALVTLEALDVEAGKPENAKYRSQLEAPSAFYRAVCEANVGQADKAQADFETFLRAQPNAALDEKAYSKKAAAAFAAAQKAIASQGPSIARAYAEFKAPPPEKDVPSASWGEGPVKWLMTDSEKAAWAAATTDDARAAFIEKFWKARTLEDDSSFRTTFDRRVAFADVNFKQGETAGSLTDRGMVFVLLGPPTYGGRRRLGAKEDKSESAGMSSVGDHDSLIAQKQLGGKASTSQLAAINDRYSGPGTEAAQSSMDYQEVWHYRKELLPKGVSYLQVDAVFVTKKGYGQNVLQRESDILTTLSAAKQKPS